MTAIENAPQARAEPSSRQAFAHTPIASAVALAVLSLSATGARAQALPTGGSVSAGSATITQTNPSTLTINQATQKAALDWQTFSIGSGNSVIFNQPNAASVALNRVVGGSRSEIYGSLQANGQVFLLNPAGVYMSAGASIDVGGLVASTLNLSNADFMKGNYAFTGGAGSGSIVNEATIRVPKGGYVAFLGKQVHNKGTVVASNGSVAFGAGDSMLLDFDGDGLLQLKVNAAAADAAITHGGVIQADGGRVIMSAAAKNALLKTVLNVDGMILARGMAERDGQIWLDGGKSGVTSVTSLVDASSNAGKGGDIRVLGEYVGLFGNATLDASGATGGGSVLVGGDFQGKNPDVANAFRTYVAKDAQIRADAITVGDGGKVIVWADDATRFYGSISARGGADAGNGGFVEVSGKKALAFSGAVDTSAPNGGSGTLLLDPTNINIVAVGTDDLEAADGTVAFTDRPGETLSISGTAVGAIAGAVSLQAENNIAVQAGGAIVKAAGDLALRAGNSVTIGDSINLTAGSLTMSARDPGAAAPAAAGNVAINAPVSAGGSVTITTNGGSGSVGLGANVTAGTSVALTGGTGGITQSGGIITATTLTANATGPVSLTQNNAFTSLGASSGVGFSVLDVNSLTVTGAVDAGAGALSISTNGDMTVNAGATLAGGTGVTLNSAGNISLGAAAGGTTNGAIDIIADSDANGTGTLTTTAAGTIGNGSATTVTLQGTDLVLGANVTGASVVLRPSTNAATIGIEDATKDFKVSDAEIDLITAGSLLTIGTTANTGGITLGTDAPITAGSKNIELVTAGTLAVNAANGITTTGALAFTADDMALAGGTISGTSVTLRPTTAGRQIDLGTNTAGTLGLTSAEIDTVTTGALTIGRSDGTAAGNITLTDAIAPTGTTSLVLRTGGSITQGAGKTISEATLGLVAGTGVTLTDAGNDVTNLTGFVTAAGNFAFTDANAFTVVGAAAVNPTVANGVQTTNGSIALTGTTLNLASNLVTAGGAGAASAVTLTGPVVLASDVTINTSAGGGDVSFSSTINADDAAANNRSLTILAGAGATTFGGAIGNSQPLAGLAVTAGAINLNDPTINVNDDNAPATTVSFTGPVVLGANVTVNTDKAAGSDNNVTFTSTVNADDAAANNRTLTVTAGAGTATFGGSIGTTQALADLDVTAGSIAFNAASAIVNDQGGNTVTLNGPVTLGQSATFNTDGAADNNITFGSTINADLAANNRTLTVTAGTGTATFSGNVGATQTLADFDVTAGSIVFNAGAAQTVSVATQTGNTATLTGPVTLSQDLTINTGNTDSVLIAGNIGETGSRSLTKTGAGTLTLTGGASTYSGGTNINGGVLSISADANLGAVAPLTFDGGTLQATATFTLNAGRATTLNAGGGTFQVDPTFTLTYDGNISGTGALTKTGTGTLALGGTNTYGGDTNINAGTLSVTNSNAIPDFLAATRSGAVIVANGATFELQANEVIGSLSGVAGATVQLNANILNTGENNTSTTFAGQITGAGGLIKSGTGTFTLSGANSYSGATNVNAGVLNLQNDTAAGTAAGGVTVLSGAALELQGDITVGNEALTISGTGVGGNGALRNVSGFNTWGGTVTLAAPSTIQSDAGTLTLNNANAVTGAGQNLTLQGAGDGAISGIIATTTGTLTKAGAGTWVLSGANTYSGTTTIAGGTLAANSTDALGDGSATNTLIFNGAGATLRADASFVSPATRSVTLTTTGTIATQANDVTIAGVISGPGGLTKTSPVGTLRLEGANTYDGTTTVAAGALIAANATALGSTVGGTVLDPSAELRIAGVAIGGEALTLATGSRLRGTGAASFGGATTLVTGSTSSAEIQVDGAGTLTVSGIIDDGAGTFGITKTGTGTLTLSGANTYDGVTNVNTGTLVAANAAALGTTTGGTVVSNGANLSIANVAIGSEALTLSGGNALTATGTGASLAGAITLVTADSTITVNGTDALTLSGAIGDGAGTFGIVKAGTGTLTLSGASTYDGATTINAGTLVAASSGALGTNTGGTTVASGAQLALQGGITIADAVSLGNNSNLRNLSGDNTVSGTVTLVGAAGDASGITSDAGTLTFSAANSITGAGPDLQFSGAGNFVVNGTITTGSAGLQKFGAGTLTLAGNNTYTGMTSIEEGTLRATDSGALGTSAGGTGINNGATLELQGNITIADALNTNAGGGTLLNASGNNTLTGAFSSGGAATIVQSDAGLLTMTGPVTGSAVTFQGASDITVSGVINNGSNGITKAGTGTLTLSGANTYTGATTINAGRVIATNSGSLGTAAAGTTVANGAALELQGNITLADALSIAGTGIGGNGAVRNLTGSNTLSGTVTLTGASTLQTDAGTLTLSAPNSITGAGQNVTFQGAGDTLVSGTITTGAGTLTKEGAGALTLSGNNTYTGTTTINAGTLTATNSGALGTSAGGTTVANGATLALQGGITIADALTIAGSGVGGNGAVRNVTGNNTLTGAVTLNAASTLQSDAGTLTLNNAFAVNGAQDLTFQGAGDGAISGAINTTSGSLTKNGTGTLTLSGLNNYQGGTSINAGTLVAASNSALGNPAGTATVANGATLSLQGGISIVNPLNIAGTGVGGNGALRNLSGNNTVGGAVTLTGASTIQSDAGNLTLNNANAITGTNQNLTFQGAGDAFVSGIIATGSGTLTKNGAGTLMLSGANTYAGTTAINGGTLVALNNTALGAADGTAGTGTTVANGANLTISGVVAIGNEAVTLNGGLALTGVGSASLAGPVTLATADSTITVNGSDLLTLSGAIGDGAGSFGIVKAGTGFLALNGANTYDGTTTVNAGTLIANNASSLGSTTGGTIVANGANLTIAAAIGNEAVTLNGGTALTGQGGGASLSGPITLATADSTITVNGALTLSGPIGDGAGTFGITKAGTGTLALAGANTYDGVTNINAGTLIASNASALGSTTGGTTVANGANLTIANVAIGNEALTLNGGSALTGTGAGAFLSGNVTLNADSTITAGTGDTFTIIGTIADGAGTFGITKAGAGTLNLGGANTYDGLTTVAAGTLLLSNSLALGSTANGTVVNSGANLTLGGTLFAGEALTLNGGNALSGSGTWTGPVTLATADSTITVNTGNSLAITGVIGDGVGTFGIAKVGAGTLALEGVNTYGGTTTITGGILAASSSAALGDATSTNTLILNGGTLRADGAMDSAATRGVQLASSSIVNTNGNTVTLRGVVSGNSTSGLTKNGANALVLTGNNTFDGALTVNGGVLVAANNNALGSTVGGTTINGPATLRISNAAVGGESVTLNNGGVLVGTGTASLAGNVLLSNANTTITADGTDSLTLSGVISDGAGTLGFTKTGTGTLALTGANTYDGGTTLAAGTLRGQGNAGALGLGTLTLNDGTALQLAGDTGIAFGNNTTVAGNVSIESDRVTAGGGVTHTLGTLSIGSNTLTLNRDATVTSGTAGLTFGATTLTGNPTFAPANGTLLTLGAVSGAGRNLTVNGAGSMTFAGSVGDATNRLGAIQVTNANNVTASGAVTAASFVQNAGTGTTQLDGAVNTNAAAGVSLTGNTQIVNNTITTTGGGGVTFANAGTLTINGNVVSDGAVAQTGAGGVSIVSRDITTTGDAVSFAAPVTLTGGGITTIDTTSGSPVGNSILFNNTIGGSGAESLTVNSGTSALNVNGAVSGLNDLTLTSAGTATFGAGVTIGGAFTQTNAATTTFNGAVATGGALTLTNAGTTTFAGALHVGGALIQSNAATGATTFGGPVTAASATLRGTTFDVNNSFATTGALNVTNSGTFTKNATGDINAGGGVAISGNASLTNSIITGNTAVSIGGATALTGPTTVSTGTGNVTFTGAVTGNQALNVNSTGTTTFTSPVSIGSLTTNAGGSTAINGGAVTTTGAQTYGDAVTLGTNTIFASTGNADIAFGNTLNGGVTVNVNTGGVTRFLGAVGGAAGGALASLTTDASGSTDINGGSVTTTGAQTYNDPVTLTANTTLTSNNAAITFANNVNSDATARSLTVGAGTATVTFTGNVGNTAALSDLDVNAGSILFNGAAAQTVNVNAGGGNTITFNAPVVLAQNLTVNTDGPAADNNVIFTNRINADTAAAARSLTVTTGSGTSRFQQGIGAGVADRELFAVTLSGASVDINGDVLVNGGGAVDLQGVTNLTFSDGAKIDTDRTGGTTAAGNVLLASTTKANPATATFTAPVTWTIDATADGGAASGNVQLGTIGDVTPLKVFNVFGENANVVGPVKATQIAITANSVATNGAGVLIASKDFANDSAITNAAVKLQGLTGPGVFGTVDNFLQIQAPGLFVVIPNESNALPVVFLGGDPSLKPVYEFANDPSKRVVLYNGVAPDSPAARAALGAALAPLREVISEVLLAGFAKENIRRQLVQGQVLETGLARPGIDEFTGEGVQQQPSCQGSSNAAAAGNIACQ
ncbi:MAG TPA: autotransporter-associated beta strand repeat-containing protein [Burkholderiales bacterium]|nr:autotransporter-associated beta strand repeat-containing protein [Burkholderiales bacterium]